jgi:molybdenum cofactor cytidylyltransferase
LFLNAEHVAFCFYKEQKMRFLRVPISQAAGSVLAHNVIDAEGRRILKKGELLSDRHLGKLASCGRDFVYVAQLETGDIGEDEAARRVAAAIAGPGAFSPHAATGRANLKATTAGLLRVNVEAAVHLNEIDDGITLATLTTHAFVRASQMVATVKIIPFAVSRNAVQAVEEYSRSVTPIISVQALPARQVGLIVTAHQNQHQRIAAEFAPALQARLEQLGSAITRTDFVEHEIADIAPAIRRQLAAGCEMILIVSMTAIIDRHDVVPMAIEEAGGVVEHFGAPVDPGNLLLIGYAGSVPIIGAPGCVRSPKVNAFDLVLPRLLAGERITRRDLVRLGHGGLLEEIRERRLLREAID